jgi:hypothetical protein
VVSEFAIEWSFKAKSIKETVVFASYSTKDWGVLMVKAPISSLT